jgi:predicted RNA-binding protein (virulence factor B family)
LEGTFLLALDKAKQVKAKLKVDAVVEKLKEKLRAHISEEEVNALVQAADDGAVTPASELPESQVPEPESLEVLESPWSYSAFSETSMS